MKEKQKQSKCGIPDYDHYSDCRTSIGTGIFGTIEIFTYLWHIHWGILLGIHFVRGTQREYNSKPLKT